MTDYKHILVAVDFSEYSEVIAGNAYDISQKYQSKLSILHVVDNMPIADSVYGPVIPYDFDLEERLLETGRKHLTELANKFSVPKENQWLEIGSPKHEIIRIAKEYDVDLIVVGSHGRHGIALLLGSTANGVLHHATCDVLAVRLKDE